MLEQSRVSQKLFQNNYFEKFKKIIFGLDLDPKIHDPDRLRVDPFHLKNDPFQTFSIQFRKLFIVLDQTDPK